MNGSGVVFTGSSGNRFVDFCDDYLYFGRKQDAIYRQVEDSKVIVGEDKSENLFLMALRISSWITVIFPLIAVAVVRFCSKQNEEKDLKDWKPVWMKDIWDPLKPDVGRTAGVQGHFQKCMKVSGIDKVAYNNIYPKVLVEGRPQGVFASDYGDYFGQEKGPDTLVVVSVDKVKVNNTSPLYEESKEYDTVVCILSPRDSESMEVRSEGRKFSRAFKQVLTHQI